MILYVMVGIFTLMILVIAILCQWKNVIILGQCCHDFAGDTYNASYITTLGTVIKKYKKKFCRVQTTCVNIKCNLCRIGYIMVFPS